MNSALHLLALVLALAAVMPLTTEAFRVDSRLISNSATCISPSTLNQIESLRAGAIEDSDDEYDDEYDSEEEEEVVVKKTKLSKSAVKASKKSSTKKKQEVKAKVSKTLEKKPKKKSLFKIPYLLRAFLNPFTVAAMIKGYMASLFNIDYLQQDSSSSLRSALEEKAKRDAAAGGGAKKRGRKMKPGQAKTISDLPVLNA